MYWSFVSPNNELLTCYEATKQELFHSEMLWRRLLDILRPMYWTWDCLLNRVALNWIQFLCSSNSLGWEYVKSIKIPIEKSFQFSSLVSVDRSHIRANVSFSEIVPGWNQFKHTHTLCLCENNIAVLYGNILQGCFRSKGLNSD